MGLPLEYPASLPVPQAMSAQSAERRALAPAGGKFEARALQRDRLSTEQIVFPPMNAIDTAEFWRWFKDDLIDGGAKFASIWPTMQGLVARVRRWLGVPHAEFIPTPQGNYWRISGQCEVMGSSKAPTKSSTLFLLHFDGSLVDECGHYFEANDRTVDGTPNQFAFTADSPKFGTAAGRWAEHVSHVVSGVFPDLILGSKVGQIEGWVRLTNHGPSGGIGGPVLEVYALDDGVPGNGAGVIGSGIRGKQLKINYESVTGGSTAELTCTYAADTGSGRTPSRVGAAVLTPVDNTSWRHWAFVWDDHSTRLYSHGTLSREDVGHKPFDGLRVDQQICIGCSYGGGVPPLDFYNVRIDGDIDEVRMLFGEVTYTGSSISVPSAPFRK